MTDHDPQLELQAFVDGELGPADTARVTARLNQDPEARRCVEQLRALKDLLVGQELPRPVPDSRAFYWSRIERDIATGERNSERAAVRSAGVAWWLRWLAPALGVALLALAVTFPAWLRPGGPPSHALPTALLETATETMLEEASTISFRSESEAMTVVWVQTHLD